MRRVAVHREDFLFGEVAHETGGSAHDECAGRNGFAFGDETARADNGVFTDDGAIEHNRTHADQSTAFDGAAMQNGGVSDGDVVSNDAGKTFFRMNDRIVLYVAADSHGDGLQVSAQYGPRPDTAVVFEFHTTDHLRGFCGPGGKRYPRDVVFEGESSPNRTTAKSQKVAWVWDCTDT